MTWWEDETPAKPPAPEPASAPIAAARATPLQLAGPGAASNVYMPIFGMKGMGKTTLARQLYAARIEAGRSGTFIDRIGNNGSLAGLRRGVIVRSPAGWYAEVRAAIAEQRAFNIIVQPGRGTSKEMRKLWAMIYEVGDCLLCIDEAEGYANAHSIDPELHELVSLGRNQQIDAIFTVRTPPELHRVIRGNADVVISFRQPSAHYADVLNKEHFHHPRGSAILQGLPRFGYLRAENGSITMGKVQL